MKFLVDHNLSPRLCEYLGSFGHLAIHAQALGLQRASDATIAAFARDEGYVIITADSDFPTMLALSGAAEPSVIHLKGDYPTEPARLAVLINNQLAQLTAFLESGAVAALDGTRIRVRELPITKE